MTNQKNLDSKIADFSAKVQTEAQKNASIVVLGLGKCQFLTSWHLIQKEFSYPDGNQGMKSTIVGFDVLYGRTASREISSWVAEKLPEESGNYLVLEDCYSRTGKTGGDFPHARGVSPETKASFEARLELFLDGTADDAVI